MGKLILIPLPVPSQSIFRCNATQNGIKKKIMSWIKIKRHHQQLKEMKFEEKNYIIFDEQLQFFNSEESLQILKEKDE